MAVEAEGSTPRPMSFGMSFDVIETLSSAPRGADWLRKLREHVADLHALTTPFADIHEASNAKLEAERQLKRLTDHPHDGGLIQTPYLNSNGTSPKELLNQQMDVMRALIIAIEKLRAAAPNGRDYQTAPPGTPSGRWKSMPNASGTLRR